MAIKLHRFFFVTVLFLGCAQWLYAQNADSVALRHSTVKSLSDQQYNAILNGDDVNDFGHLAAIYHFPMPDDVLKYSKELNLTPKQVIGLNEINRVLHMKKKEVGLSVMSNERMLDSLFRTKRLNDGVIIYYTNRYGLYQGEYRGALLMASYNTRKLLNPTQVNKFYELQNHN